MLPFLRKREGDEVREGKKRGAEIPLRYMREGRSREGRTRPSQSDQPLHEPDPALLQGASEDPQEEHQEVAERGLLYVREPPGDFRRALGLGFRKNIFFRENPQKEGHLDGLINTIVPPSQ